MNDISSDDILLLKQRLAEQEALNRALLEKLADREREIDHLQAQLDKLRRMNFGSRSEKVSRRIAQMEADLNRLQKESDTLTGRVTRQCSALCVRPAPANRSPNHSPR
jgi:transposase